MPGPARRLLLAACIAFMFEGACLGLGEGDLQWPFIANAGGAVTVVIQVTMMTWESAGTAATATPTPGMEAAVAIADATRIPGAMTTEGYC